MLHSSCLQNSEESVHHPKDFGGTLGLSNPFPSQRPFLAFMFEHRVFRVGLGQVLPLEVPNSLPWRYVQLGVDFLDLLIEFCHACVSVSSLAFTYLPQQVAYGMASDTKINGVHSVQADCQRVDPTYSKNLVAAQWLTQLFRCEQLASPSKAKFTPGLLWLHKPCLSAFACLFGFATKVSMSHLLGQTLASYPVPLLQKTRPIHPKPLPTSLLWWWFWGWPTGAAGCCQLEERCKCFS